MAVARLDLGQSGCNLEYPYYMLRVHNKYSTRKQKTRE